MNRLEWIIEQLDSIARQTTIARAILSKGASPALAEHMLAVVQKTAEDTITTLVEAKKEEEITNDP